MTYKEVNTTTPVDTYNAKFTPKTLKTTNTKQL